MVKNGQMTLNPRDLTIYSCLECVCVCACRGGLNSDHYGS